MPIDLTKKCVPALGKILLVEPDGSPMIDPDTNEQAYVRAHSPASKVWETAAAARKRKAMKKVREQGGKMEAAAESSEDKVEFLANIIEEFVGVAVPLPEGESGAKAMVRAILDNPALGFIRDYLDLKSQDWGSFLPLSSAS